MINYILIIPILASFFVTLFIVPSWTKRARKANLIGKDIHKKDKMEVPEAGGVTVVVGFALGVLIYVAINTFILDSTENFIEIFALLSTIFLISFIAFTDDILGWKIGLRRRTRLVLVAFSAIPLIVINAGKSVIVLPFNGITDLGIFYPLVLIPFGIVGATTTFNLLAGYNGLETGQSIILLAAFGLVAYATGNSWLAVISLCMIGALTAFLLYNFYPAKVFPGDSLTYAVGGLLAILSILGNFEKVALFFFIPYIIETGLKIRGGLVKQSFGRLKEDGSLELRYKKIYGLEHAAIWLLNKTKWKATEKRVVYSIWAFQIVIVLIGLIIFREGIF